MSDDADDRMARATRIRQMREGQREAATADGESDDSAGEATAESDEGPASSTDPDDAETADAEGGDPTGSDATDDREDVTASPEEHAEVSDRQRQTGTDSDDEIDSAGTDRSADEATAAARQAARSAAQMTVGDGDATAAGPDAQAQQAIEQQATGGQQAAAMQGPTGIELPDQDSLEAAVAEQDADADDGMARRRADADDQLTQEETVRVLEFTLGDEQYCLDITHVEEIVERDSITRVPNTDDYVEGVVDLRGQITTIIDPKYLLDIDQGGEESLLVVFDPDGFEDQGAIGWIVDAVRQVVPIAKSEINDPPVDKDYIEGVVDREDEADFVIWTDPELAISLAMLDEDDD